MAEPTYDDSFLGCTAVVTGAGGYVGALLVAELLRLGAREVRQLDLAFAAPNAVPDSLAAPHWNVDVRDAAQVARVCKDADVVFHLASYGMSGSAQLNRRKVQAINIGGTANVVSACRRQGVRALVQVSTYNTVFCGKPIHDGGEDAPYVADGSHVDEYSRTKCIAEQQALAADSKDSLRVAAVRPAAIYGEHETRHMPRILATLNSGLDFFSIGSAAVQCDWVHGSNLAHGILLCAKALLAQDANVCGHAFPIADGAPINNFDFLRQVLGDSSLFSLRLPADGMFAIATVVEAVHRLVAPVWPFEPLLTRAEVCKVGYTHYFSMQGPRRRLGYVPLLSAAEGMGRTRRAFAGQLWPVARRRRALLRQVIVLLAVAMVLGVVLLGVTSLC